MPLCCVMLCLLSGASNCYFTLSNLEFAPTRPILGLECLCPTEHGAFVHVSPQICILRHCRCRRCWFFLPLFVLAVSVMFVTAVQCRRRCSWCTARTFLRICFWSKSIHPVHSVVKCTSTHTLVPQDTSYASHVDLLFSSKKRRSHSRKDDRVDGPFEELEGVHHLHLPPHSPKR